MEIKRKFSIQKSCKKISKNKTQSHKKLRAYPRRKRDKKVQDFILEAFNSNLFSSALFS